MHLRLRQGPVRQARTVRLGEAADAQAAREHLAHSGRLVEAQHRVQRGRGRLAQPGVVPAAQVRQQRGQAARAPQRGRLGHARAVRRERAHQLQRLRGSCRAKLTGIPLDQGISR